MVDEFSRECLAIRVGRRLGSTEVIDMLTDLFINRGIPAFLRLDNGPKFIATTVKAWITTLGARPAYIEPGSLRRHSTCCAGGNLASSVRGRTVVWKASTARFRDELLACEMFNTLAEAKILIEQWRVHYNTVRPHSSLGYRPPAPEVVLPRMPMPTSTPDPAGAAAAIGITMN